MLTANNLGAEDAKYLCEALQVNSIISRLDLSCTHSHDIMKVWRFAN